MVISVNLGVVIAGLPNSLPYTGQSNLTALYTHSRASKTKSLRICVASSAMTSSNGAELQSVGNFPTPVYWALLALLCFQHEELVGPGFGTPNFALAARELPYVRVAIGQRERLEFLGLGIEAQDRVRTPVADPHCIGLVDIDGIGLRPVARQVPACPSLGFAVVTEEITAVPAGDPQPAAAVAPDAPGALTRYGRFQDRGGAGLEIDLTE